MIAHQSLNLNAVAENFDVSRPAISKHIKILTQCGLVVIKLHSGELAAHSHEQEHVGVVLEGEFEFFNDEEVTSLKAGDMYRIGPNVVHGIRCQNYALIVQARA